MGGNKKFRPSKQWLHACSSFVLGSILAFTLQIYVFSPISPDPLHLPQLPSPHNFPTNKLQEVTKIGEGLLDKPEDLCFDQEGILYTATRDGWIKRMNRNGSWEDWRHIGGDSLLGVTTTRTGGIVVCDAEKGLLKVGEDGVSHLTSHVDGSRIRFADNVIEASDGSVYFSVASTKFGYHEWHLDLLEAKPNGKLLKNDPSLNQTSILLHNLYFPNGVALSQDEHFLVFCETWKCGCLKYWLKGERKGTTEVFIGNLFGGPDNINLAPDGSFWIALIEVWDLCIRQKHLVATFPKLLGLIQSIYKKSTVVKVGADGKMIKRFDDPNGSLMSMVTSALEFEGHLYLGSLNSNFIGKLPLRAT